jgi:hypothetical protein
MVARIVRAWNEESAMNTPADTNPLTHALRRLNYAEQRHFIAGVRSMFGCRVQKFTPVIFEMAWEKLATAEREAVIRHVLNLYENFRVPS